MSQIKAQLVEAHLKKTEALMNIIKDSKNEAKDKDKDSKDNRDSKDKKVHKKRKKSQEEHAALLTPARVFVSIPPV